MPKSIFPVRSLFPLGTLVITARAGEQVAPDDVGRALIRHGNGDWGDVSEEDCAANDRAFDYNERIKSVWRNREGVAFWIITEADRNATTVLLPDDY